MKSGILAAEAIFEDIDKAEEITNYEKLIKNLAGYGLNYTK